jgi:probable rRNA maturation factor
MKVSLDISVPSSLWRGLPRARAIARETIAAAAAESGVVREEVEVSLCLADDAALRALNSRWRGIDKPTNVLSFPSSSGGRLGDATTLGDIALAYETLAREAEDLGVPLADHYRHLLAHGFLHLIGYDHETDAEAERMEALETRILARLGAADPYAREFIGG